METFIEAIADSNPPKLASPKGVCIVEAHTRRHNLDSWLEEVKTWYDEAQMSATSALLDIKDGALGYALIDKATGELYAVCSYRRNRTTLSEDYDEFYHVTWIASRIKGHQFGAKVLGMLFRRAQRENLPVALLAARNTHNWYKRQGMVHTSLLGKPDGFIRWPENNTDEFDIIMA